jgi:hypothetical protein
MVRGVTFPLLLSSSFSNSNNLPIFEVSANNKNNKYFKTQIANMANILVEQCWAYKRVCVCVRVCSCAHVCTCACLYTHMCALGGDPLRRDAFSWLMEFTQPWDGCVLPKEQGISCISALAKLGHPQLSQGLQAPRTE